MEIHLLQTRWAALLRSREISGWIQPFCARHTVMTPYAVERSLTREIVPTGTAPECDYGLQRIDYRLRRLQRLAAAWAQPQIRKDTDTYGWNYRGGGIALSIRGALFSGDECLPSIDQPIEQERHGSYAIAPASRQETINMAQGSVRPQISHTANKIKEHLKRYWRQHESEFFTRPFHRATSRPL